MRARRLRDPLEQLAAVERLGLDVEPADVELVREQDLVDDPAEAVRLLDDQRDEPLAPRLVEREVVAAQGLRRAVHGRERRAQLVRGRRDELGLELVEPVRLGDVPERVDRPAEERDAGDRDPALAASVSSGSASAWVGSPAAAIGTRFEIWSQPRITSAAGWPTTDSAERPVIASAIGFHRPDDAGPVDEEDAVADVGEDARRLGPRLDLVVQAGGVDRERGHPGERSHPREVVRGEAPTARPHQRERPSARPPGDERGGDPRRR